MTNQPDEQGENDRIAQNVWKTTRESKIGSQEYKPELRVQSWSYVNHMRQRH